MNAVAHAAVRAEIAESLDVFAARWSAQRLAAGIGFSPPACAEIAIVVSELATNILKYGVRGAIVMARTDDGALGPGLELVAEDEGPLLTDLATAIRDGYGDAGPIDPCRQLGRGGIGAGLGAIIRLTDRFEYLPRGAKKSFRAVRYLRRPRPGNPP